MDPEEFGMDLERLGMDSGKDPEDPGGSRGVQDRSRRVWDGSGESGWIQRVLMDPGKFGMDVKRFGIDPGRLQMDPEDPGGPREAQDGPSEIWGGPREVWAPRSSLPALTPPCSGQLSRLG